MRRSRISKRRTAIMAFATLLAGCELREIMIAAPEDVIVAEIVLRANSPLQKAYLHRTATGEGDARVFGAQIVITESSTGRSFALDVENVAVCLGPDAPTDLPSVGTCYAATVSPNAVQPGETYTLRVDLQGGGVLTGSTTVPAAFAMRQPTALEWVIAPDTSYEFIWTRSAGTAVYLVEVAMSGLLEALRSRGVAVSGDEGVDLLGLAVTESDTTLVFPSELGLFDRFDDDMHAILLAIRGGLPPNVFSIVSISAADRNYVNWARGGNFNPSGVVRVSSVRGDGIGVFGSVVSRSFTVRTAGPSQASDHPPGH